MPVAVKELLRSITSDDMQREMAILRTVTHKNVVRYYTHASDASYHYLVLERCDCSLEQAVLPQRKGDFPGPLVEGPARTPTATCMAVAMGMVEGLVELQRAGVVHRDLKPSNILLSRGRGSGDQAPVVAKIADLGLGKALGHGQSSFMSSRAGGTQCWQAPEQIQPPPGAHCACSPFVPFPPPWLHLIFKQTISCPTLCRVQTLPSLYEPPLWYLFSADGKYDRRLDVFLLGCLLHFCFTGGQHPFGPAVYQQIVNIMHGRPDLAALDHLPVHQALVAKMLATVMWPWL